MIQARPFNLKNVRLLEGIFFDNMQRDSAYLLSLEPDRFLHNFRVVAGLPSGVEPYGGWEDPEMQLRGHTLGHYLSACSLMYASSDNPEFKQQVDYIVEALAKCQEAMPSQGYNAGFLSAYPETFFDLVDKRDPVWAPYYTLHKILAGLIDAYQHCANEKALTILDKMAQWLDFRTSRLSEEQMEISLLNEPGGITESFAMLYEITKQQIYLDLLYRFNHKLVLTPLANGEDRLDRLHANTQIPKVIGAALQYEATGDERSRRIAEFFWQTVVDTRSYAIGGNSDDELFFPVDRFDQHLSTVAAETCNTHNMLKLTRHIFAWQPSAKVMDYYERALFNHILGSQDPKTGMMTYFISHKPGHIKLYNLPESSFWCCTGTGMENHVKYGDTIYFHDDNSLYVNLFIASELNWEDKRLVLRQETQFPEEDATRMTITCDTPIQLSIKVRYPSWAGSIQIKINGQLEEINADAGSYIELKREWQNGDMVEVQLEMYLHLEALPNCPNIVAFLYGPIVLVGALGTEDMPDVYLTNNHVRSNPINHLPTPDVPVLRGQVSKLVEHVKPVAGQSLIFKTEGIGFPDDVELVPFYRLHHQRYNIYWTVQD